MAAHHPDTERVARRRPRKLAGLGLAGVVVATLGVLAPTPTIVSAQEAQVRTERVTLSPRERDRSADAVGTAAADSAEGQHLREALASPGRRTTPVRAADHHALGITVAAVPDEPVLVRGRVRGAWTPWFELAFAAGEAPDLGSPESAGPAGAVHSEPVWMGDADAYELDAPAALHQVDVHLVVDGPARRRVVLAPAPAGAAGAPSILSRSAWGAKPPSKHPATSADLKLAIVHHSVNGNTYSSGQVPQLLRSIQSYHQDVQGWNDIAYNFVVDRFGRTWEGRAGGTANVVVGGHSQGFNTGAVGVVALGDFRTASAPASMVEAIAKVIAWKFAVHRVDPASRVPFTSAGSAKYEPGRVVTLPRIVGHRDVQATDCPGGFLYPRLGTIRNRVAQLVPAYQQGLAPIALAPDVTGDGLTDPFEYQPGATRDLQWTARPSGAFARTSTPVAGAYRPVVGDFDGNGRDDILWHGTGSSPDSIWWSVPGGRVTQALSVGGSYVPVPGDFDGNGVDDIFWYSTGPGADSTWYFRSDRSHVARAVDQDLVTGVPLTGDFDGDGRDDIFWYGPGDATDTLWRGSGQRWVVTAKTVSGWYSPVVLDAAGDGHDDILWYAPGSGSASRWSFTAGQHTARVLTAPAVPGRPTVGDFDGDGRDDVALIAPGAAADAVWYSEPDGTIRAWPIRLTGTYVVTGGPMDVEPLSSTDDLLLLSGPADHLLEGLPSRGFRVTQVG